MMSALSPTLDLSPDGYRDFYLRHLRYHLHLSQTAHYSP